MRLLFTISVAILSCGEAYNASNGFKFGAPNYDDSLNIQGQNSPGFETLTGARFEPWLDTWNGTDGGYNQREYYADITRGDITKGEVLIKGNYIRENPSDPMIWVKSGTMDIVHDGDDDAIPKSLRWAEEWAKTNTYHRDDYGINGKEIQSGVYPLDDKAKEAIYRQHHAELHQNGHHHYSPGLFPELALDETHRYFMDGEAWPRTEKEYRYSFKTWGGDYRAGTLVKDMNLGGGSDVHQYKFGQNYTNSTISKGNQPDLFADAPNGGDQEVYTPRLDFSWTNKKYTALNAKTENSYSAYIAGRERLNGGDGNTAVQWNWDRRPKKAEDKTTIADVSGIPADMSVTLEEQDWNSQSKSGVWGWNAGHPVLGWNGTQTSNFPVLDYETGPNGKGLTTAVGDLYGWNTNEAYGYGKLDTFRTWNMNGRKV